MLNSGVVHLSCGNHNCIYGNEEGAEIAHGYCKCIPYNNLVPGLKEKVSSAKWAIHFLRKQNKRLWEENARLINRLYSEK